MYGKQLQKVRLAGTYHQIAFGGQLAYLLKRIQSTLTKGCDSNMSPQFESLLHYCSENGRVCPSPIKWNELWMMLPNRSRRNNSNAPAQPLILAAWHEASDEQKAIRFREHLAWAEKHGGLDGVDTFLRNLSESDWYHLNE